jgi:hypothetical protein
MDGLIRCKRGDSDEKIQRQYICDVCDMIEKIVMNRFVVVFVGLVSNIHHQQ